MFADKAATVRDLGVRISLITRIFSASMLLIPALATALVYGVGGHLAIEGTLTVGTLLALGTLLLRLLGPAAGALQRPDRRDDRPGQLRAGLRGARPALDDPGASPTRCALPRSAARLEFDHVAFTYPRADEISLASLESVARTESRDSGQVLADISFVGRARPDGGAGRAVGRRQDHGHPPRRPALRRRARVSVRVGGHDVRDVTLAVARGHRRVRHPGRPHVPRHDPGEPALRPARRDRRPRSGRRWSPRRSPPSSAACPTGSTPWSATAATASPAASGSGWRSRGCCSRRPRSSSSTRPPPTSTASRRQPSSVRSTPPWRAGPRW